MPLPPEDALPLFDFFGLRQQVLAPVAEHDPLLNAVQEEQDEQNIQGQQEL